MRLVEQRALDCNDTSHFFAVASKKMREILSNHARQVHVQSDGSWRLLLELHTGDGVLQVVDVRDVDQIECH